MRSAQPVDVATRGEEGGGRSGPKLADHDLATCTPLSAKSVLRKTSACLSCNIASWSADIYHLYYYLYFINCELITTQIVFFTHIMFEYLAYVAKLLLDRY